MTMNQLSYKVLNDRSIFVFPDTPPKHAQYDEQVVRTFYISHADATELSQTLSTLIRLPGIAVQPMIAANKTANTITVRGDDARSCRFSSGSSSRTTSRAPRSSSTSRFSKSIATRTKSYGLNLSEYAIGAIFSPVVAPGRPDHDRRRRRRRRTPTGAGTTTTGTGTSTPPSALSVAAAVQPQHDLARRQHGRLLSGGADRHRAVPRDATRSTKLIAKPQLRGAEGSKLSLKLGDSRSRSSRPATRRLRPAAPA